MTASTGFFRDEILPTFGGIPTLELFLIKNKKHEEKKNIFKKKYLKK